MLALGAESASLATSVVLAGLALLILPLVPRNSPVVRAALCLIAILLSWRYMIWRFTETVPSFDLSIEGLAGWCFVLLEGATVLSSSFAFVILSRTLDRSPEADRAAGWWRPGPEPQVDILIATYNEEAAILERTIVGALAVRHQRKRVWVLDDKRRPWLREMCGHFGVRYLTRADNAHAKAGNINAAFAVLRREETPPDFVAVLDADFVPHRNFLERSLALFHDPVVGLVQTPQHFFNADPIQHNLGIGQAYPDEQRFFFDHLQPARDAWGISICCGTSSVMRWTALEVIGGFPLGSVTEDYLITLRLREEGYATAYLGEPLTEGLAPEGLGEYVTQRGRWCLGLMQIVRGPLGPFARNRLQLRDRLGVLDSFLYWAASFLFRLACLAMPLAYWFFGITVVNATLEGLLTYFLPYYLAALLAINWSSRGLIVPVMHDIGQLLGAYEITKAVVVGLARTKGHKFKVTLKGGDRTRVVVQWPLLRPLLVLFVLTVLGLFFSTATDVVFDRDAGEGKWVVLFWTFYNLAVLALAMVVCVEQPRADETMTLAPERVALRASGTTFSAWLVRLGTGEAWLRGGPLVAAGTPCGLDIPGIGRIAGAVIKAEAQGSKILLQPDEEQRAAILAKLHTRDGAVRTTRTDTRGLVVALLRRAMRG